MPFSLWEAVGLSGLCECCSAHSHTGQGSVLLGVGFCARGILRQQQPEPGAGHGWGMQAEEPCQGSLPCAGTFSLSIFWKPIPSVLQRGKLGQTCRGAGGGDGVLGAPIARGVADGDTEPGVSSASPHLPFPLCVLGCLQGRKSLWRFRK